MLTLNARGTLMDWHFDMNVIDDSKATSEVPTVMDSCGWVGTSGESMFAWDHHVTDALTTESTEVQGILCKFPSVRELYGVPLDWDPRCERYGDGAAVEAAQNDATGKQSRILDAWYDFHVERLRAWEWLGALVTLVGVDKCSPDDAALLPRPLCRPLVVLDYGKDAPRSNGSYVGGDRLRGWRDDLSAQAKRVADAAHGLMPIVLLPTRSGKIVRLSTLTDCTGVFRACEVATYATKFAAQHKILSARADRLPGRGREDYVQSLRVDSLLGIETWDPRYTKLSTWLYEKWQHSNTRIQREYKAPENRNVVEDLVFVVDPWREADARLNFAGVAKRCRKVQAIKIKEYLDDIGGDPTMVYGNRQSVYALRQITSSDESNATGRKIRAGGLLEFRLRHRGG